MKQVDINCQKLGPYIIVTKGEPYPLCDEIKLNDSKNKPVFCEMKIQEPNKHTISTCICE